MLKRILRRLFSSDGTDMFTAISKYTPAGDYRTRKPVAWITILKPANTNVEVKILLDENATIGIVEEKTNIGHHKIFVFERPNSNER